MDKQQIGILGEHLVAAELTRRGYIVSLTRKNTANIDILCMDPITNRAIGIQVKTTTTKFTKKSSWVLNQKNELLNSDNVFYIFVNVHDNNSVKFFIVPSSIVSSMIKSRHQKWLKEKDKNHKDTGIRNLYYEDVTNYIDWSIMFK